MKPEDMELLKLAAKACGYKIISEQHGKLNVTCDNKTNFHWNPLIDDGDAFRLAVQLKMCIETYAFKFGLDAGHCVNICTWQDRLNGSTKRILEFVKDDAFLKATRRAIVRAAAEIERLRHALDTKL